MSFGGLSTTETALYRDESPAIFNIDQHSQIDRDAFTGALKVGGVEISIDR